jgi:hypothetical protein
VARAAGFTSRIRPRPVRARPTSLTDAPDRPRAGRLAGRASAVHVHHGRREPAAACVVVSHARTEGWRIRGGVSAPYWPVVADRRAGRARARCVWLGTIRAPAPTRRRPVSGGGGGDRHGVYPRSPTNDELVVRTGATSTGGGDGRHIQSAASGCQIGAADRVRRRIPGGIHGARTPTRAASVGRPRRSISRLNGACCVLLVYDVCTVLHRRTQL